MTKTIALFSSARANGNTFNLLRSLNKTWPMEIINLDALNIAEYDYQLVYNKDDFYPLIDKLLQADKILLASPIYWYSVTPRMKAFIDRLSELTELEEMRLKGKLLRQKSFYLACTSSNQKISEIFLDMVRSTLNYLGFPFSGYVHADCTQGFSEQHIDIEMTPAPKSEVKAELCSMLHAMHQFK